MLDVRQNLSNLITAIVSSSPPAPERIASDQPALGDCPLCGTTVRNRGKVYTCDSGRSCEFVIFSVIAGRKISNRMAKNLITEGKTPIVKGFKSRRTNKSFEAALKLNKQGKVEFDFSDVSTTPSTKAQPKKKTPPKRSKTKQKTSATPAINTPVGMPCPKCKKGRLIQGRSAWGCNRWREDCRFTFSFEQEGKNIDPAEAARRIQRL